jgi:hypothetical protein
VFVFLFRSHVAQLNEVALLDAECEYFDASMTEFFGDRFRIGGVRVSVGQ